MFKCCSRAHICNTTWMQNLFHFTRKATVSAVQVVNFNFFLPLCFGSVYFLHLIKWTVRTNCECSNAFAVRSDYLTKIPMYDRSSLSAKSKVHFEWNLAFREWEWGEKLPTASDALQCVRLEINTVDDRGYCTHHLVCADVRPKTAISNTKKHADESIAIVGNNNNKDHEKVDINSGAKVVQLIAFNIAGDDTYG